MALLDRFYTREDFHQSVEYAKVMEGIGWCSIPVDGSRFVIKPLGPIALSKMQRPRVINVNKIRELCRKLNVVHFILEPAPLSILIDKAGKKHVLSFLTPKDQMAAQKILRSCGLYKTNEHYAHTKTALIDIASSLNDVIKSLPAKTRYNIKVAKRSEVSYATTLFSAVTKKQKQDFFSLLTRWSKEKKIFGFSNDFLETVMNSFPTTGWLITAYSQDEFLGAMMVFVHDRIGYYFYTATSSKGKLFHVPTGLTQEALKLSQEKGADIFDFCSVYDERYPNEHPRWKGFTTFKERFHPLSVYYPPSFARWF
ncbi:MAG: GNAT family N-acetyltransferase [Candidatus Woesebacteria bacterium]